MHAKQDAINDSTRRTDLRTLDRHASAAEVYTALGCSYPGTDDPDDERPNANGIFYTRGARLYGKVRDSSTVEPDGRRSDSIRDDGINASHSSSGCAVRRHVGSSGFETDENVRYNHGGTMKTTRHHDRDDREQRDDHARLVTDGGEHAIPELGARMFDRDADDPNTAVVIALPEEPGYDRKIPSLDGQSVADLNPDYPASGPVATVAYAGDLDAALDRDVWREADPAALAGLCEDYEVRQYDFPIARLREVSDE